LDDWEPPLVVAEEDDVVVVAADGGFEIELGTDLSFNVINDCSMRDIRSIRKSMGQSINSTGRR